MKIVSKPVKAIVVFEYQDKPPMPHKIKMKEASGEETIVTVDRCLSVTRKKIAGIESYIYECQSLIGNELRRFELKYIIGECRWVLYKI